ncbi:MAG: NrfD/PsrC family molybdoenzyme membrane anchor subunit [Planctomycetota bacterium]|jgi:molybdopterin-containing oxidoreductase family membrane subunit|nr:NrfD/PsrC family molybdoenzyme membrane anchor subunit [Planctomycetota bacterium]MEC8390759.1 NrfD/PsrC family molybdoenzyme membrane anchor subunit [Planctomycetota bacterium]MEC8783127.1 NrfD/PsrC family molybdoenzyme membrane anchor subunit [Planctomycetota bacterium]MED5577276.1 NrfD/PsrC family molybdoenzyme membrane anchor subunit [Planctomycetota bacterium]
MATTVDQLVDNTVEDPSKRAPLVMGGLDNTGITDVVAGVAEREKPPRAWYIAFGIANLLLVMLGANILHLIFTGVGVWGNKAPQFWGWPIVNFVFWVGIGHAGTLISAILFLFRQNWRTSINRTAEAMTIFAVVCAGLFPGIHIGRVWVFYWLFPIPTEHLAMWPNFRSPLLWDVFAVSTYATVSLLFWYMGMVPDIATFRDRSTNNIKRFIYGLLSLGWTGSARAWHRYEMAYVILAALATPLVLSVHTIVSFDFAVSQLPGWHTTIFPPYFVAGAIFSGFAMVVTLMVPARELFGLKDLITIRHLENMNKIIVATGTMVGFAYGIEFFIAWYGANPYEQFAFINRAFGPFAWAYWTMVSCNVIAPQFFWFKKIRTSPWLMVVVCIFVNIGMWFERFVITITSLSRDFLPSSWDYFDPTPVDVMMLIGSFGLFFTLFLLFCRFLPMVAMAEVKSVMPQDEGDAEHEAT